MRIFANTLDWAEISDFEPYIGKDVWISCILPNSEPGYVRILDVADGLLECNVYMDTSRWVADKRYLYTRRVYPHNLRLTNPIEVVDSVTLIPDDTSDATIERFIGKPYWIKGYFDLDKDYAIKYYFNIVSASDFTLTIRYIEAWYVDEFDPEDTSGMPSEHLRGPKVVPTAAIFICDPVEVLTDEDLQATLEDNDAASLAAWPEDEDTWEDDE